MIMGNIDLIIAFSCMLARAALTFTLFLSNIGENSSEKPPNARQRRCSLHEKNQTLALAPQLRLMPWFSAIVTAIPLDLPPFPLQYFPSSFLLLFCLSRHCHNTPSYAHASAQNNPIPDAHAKMLKSPRFGPYHPN